MTAKPAHPAIRQRTVRVLADTEVMSAARHLLPCLPLDVRDAVETRNLPVETARALAAVGDPSARVSLLAEALELGWSASDVRARVPARRLLARRRATPSFGSVSARLARVCALLEGADDDALEAVSRLMDGLERAREETTPEAT